MNEPINYPRITLDNSPFNITFSWDGETAAIQLENGKDILKLADVFSKMLTENNVEHKLIKNINN
jgi:hypothetical protein